MKAVIKLEDLVSKLGFKHICSGLDKEVEGCSAGDLLSWVMSHAQYGDAWVTIMSNINVVAVASLTECACVIMAEGVVPDEDIIKTAEEKDVTILSDNRSVYEICCLIGQYLNNNE